MLAQDGVPTPPRTVSDILAGHATRWQVVSSKTNQTTGAVTAEPSTYIELADGLNYQDEEGDWQRTEPIFRETEDGFAILTGPQKVWLGRNLNEVGAVTYFCDGVLLRSAPLSLGYFDPLTGDSIVLARLKETTADRAADNVIVYRDCFDEIHGSIRYRYEPGAFHQDVILHEAPPPPSEFGLSDFSRLEVITEFAPDMPVPLATPRLLEREEDLLPRPTLVEPEFMDATLQFSDEVQMDVGEAFAIGLEEEASDAPKAAVQVGKQLTRMGGTPYLIESVSHRALAPFLERLQASHGVSAPGAMVAGWPPPTPLRTMPERNAGPTALAAANRPASAAGVVIDYVLKSGSAGNVTFMSYGTYYITGAFGVSGTATFQSGAVLKYANNAYVYCSGPMTFPAPGVPPVVFTSKDDDLFGERISGSTGVPTHHASPAIWVYYVNFSTGITNAYFRWAKTAVKYDQHDIDSFALPQTESPVYPSHAMARSKFKNSQTGVYGGYGCPTVFIDSFSTRCNVTTSKACQSQQSHGCCISGDLSDDCAGDNDFDELTDSWETTYWGGTGQQSGLGDPDQDGFSNYREMLAGLNPTTPDTVSTVLASTDDPGNPQHTQFESSLAVLNGNVIAAYVDSRQGVYGLGYYQVLGEPPPLPNRVPRFVAYSFSQFGGAVFEVKGEHPPVSTQVSGILDDGDAGDPVLAVDASLGDVGTVYLAGTSPRNHGHHGIPVWKSVDGGRTFGSPATTVRPEVETTDKPWIAVDAGNHDVFLVYQTRTEPFELCLSVAQSGNIAAGNWSKSTIRKQGDMADADPGIMVNAVTGATVAIDANHDAYVAWFERNSDSTSWLRIRNYQNHGSLARPIHKVTANPGIPLVTGSSTMRLGRSNVLLDPDDKFTVVPFPCLAANPAPSKIGHLYVAYTDKESSGGQVDKSDVFFLRSTDGGTTWQNVPVSLAQNGDQWMPTIVVSPDGGWLFVTWYDRRNDPNNEKMHLYGRFGSIDAQGAVTFRPELVLTTESFPQVFSGTASGEGDRNPGNYDPVYPPEDESLVWAYPEWPSGVESQGAWAGHVGEYNGGCADASYVYVSWTDARLPIPGTNRKQRDIRVTRLPWPWTE